MMNRIKEIRERKNINGTQVATNLDISPQYYYSLERGEKRLNEDVLRKLSKILDCSVDEILGIDDNDYLNDFLQAIKNLPKEDLDKLIASTKILYPQAFKK